MNQTITISMNSEGADVRLAILTAELVKQGVGFTVTEELQKEGDMYLITFTGAY